VLDIGVSEEIVEAIPSPQEHNKANIKKPQTIIDVTFFKVNTFSSPLV